MNIVNYFKPQEVDSSNIIYPDKSKVTVGKIISNKPDDECNAPNNIQPTEQKINTLQEKVQPAPREKLLAYQNNSKLIEQKDKLIMENNNLNRELLSKIIPLNNKEESQYNIFPSDNLIYNKNPVLMSVYNNIN